MFDSCLSNFDRNYIILDGMRKWIHLTISQSKLIRVNLQQSNKDLNQIK